MNNAHSSQRWHPLPERFRLLAAQQRGAVLLETAKFDEENFRTLLFLDPISELIAESPEQIESVFRQIDSYLAHGQYVAGFVSYDCGEATHNIPVRDPAPSDRLPLIHMGVFRAPIVFDHRTGHIIGFSGTISENTPESLATARVERSILEISEDDYTRRIQSVQDYLAAGHSYQVNFTDRVTGSFEGSPSAFYRHLIDQQPVSYAAYLDLGSRQILSLSPELFYRASNGKISVRPMKGTWPRGLSLADDERAADQLRHDPKNRAEHVTIVDLLRNDLGKVCKLGSVHVDRLMHVERYTTLHQMTSTVSGSLDTAKTSSEVFKALFPSGSITGAPKQRTMEIIREIERMPRGVYTGSIGWFGPNGEAGLNVAIRTLTVSASTFVLGVGGGITADSIPHEEYAECKLKASFLHTQRHTQKKDFHLIETMRAVSAHIPLLDVHLRRLRDSAVYFEIPLDEHALRRDIARLLEHHFESEQRVRLTLEQDGQWNIAISPLEPIAWSGRALLSSHRTDASDVFLRHKTSNRQVYEAAFRDARQRGYDEVLFTNHDGFVTEGAISNIFLLLDGILVTPETDCGLLPGVQRNHILASNPSSKSRKITLQDLLRAEQIWTCNALRRNRPVTTINDEEGNVLWRALRDIHQESTTPSVEIHAFPGV